MGCWEPIALPFEYLLVLSTVDVTICHYRKWIGKKRNGRKATAGSLNQE